METAAIWALVRKFWPAIPIVGLAVALWFSNERNHTLASDARAANEHAKTVDAANAGLSAALKAEQAKRVDNDAIAAAVADKLAGNKTREIHTQTVIERAVQSDPKVRDWADSPLPDSVRQAIRSDQTKRPAP